LQNNDKSKDLIKILFIGDIFGKPGRLAVKELITQLNIDYQPEFIIANGENAAHGMGISPKIAEFLFDCGIDVLTSGNHIWDQKSIIDYLPSEKRLLRPANYPSGVPGSGYGIFLSRLERKIAVINLEGRVFMKDLVDCPFILSKNIIQKIQDISDAIIVDFHAEVTSEKQALGFYLDGSVSAVIGTHTHVQTNDDMILPNGSAYISDVGMVGSKFSVIGAQKDIAIKKYLTSLPAKFVPEENNIMLNAVLIVIDPVTKLSKSIQKINIDFS
jgi:hypothetical protein